MRSLAWLIPLGIFVATICEKTDAEETIADESISFERTDWPWWRGADRNGIAAADQNPPLAWSSSKNILWKSNVPGRGHGSPCIVGNQIFLATANKDQETQSVICYDRDSGEKRWETIVHRGGLFKKGNKKASQASSTIACDGNQIYINFLNRDAVYTTALNMQGKQVWQTKITDYQVHQGYGSSPAIYKSLVIVSADNKKGGAIAGLDRKTGDVIWKNKRPGLPNYASPVILKVAGKDQLLFTGCNLVTSLDPLTGKTNWEIEGSTTECVTTTVTNGELIYTSGGYPKNHMSAVHADGSGKIAWSNKVRVYVPSMIVAGKYLYGVQDAGVAACWNASTGEELWRGRLEGGFTSSPVLVGKHIFVTDEEGETFVFKSSPESFQIVSQNKLGNAVFATPVYCGSRIYMRVVEKNKGKRQEVLYCIGEK